MFQFIESIRIEDQKPYLLDFHQKRVNDTFKNFGAQGSIDLGKVFKAMEHDEDGMYKWRVVYSLDKTHQSQVIPYAFPNIKDFQLVVNNTLDYAFKFEDRNIFKQMLDTAEGEEIIIVKNNHITDTSYANLLFLKGKQWYTPSTCLLNGVQRQYLLKQKKIKEIEITLENISEFSHFQLINAMNTMDNDFVYPIDKIINLPENGEYLGII